MTKILAQHADLLQRVAIHPSANFPGRTQEGLLPQLLRKKLEIPVEDWVNEGRTTQAANETAREKENDELWTWAREYVGERVAIHVLDTRGRYYTAEEREIGIENVRTGLRKNFNDDEGSEEDSNDEDEDEEMEDVGVGVTSVRRTSVGQVEFDMAQIKKVAGEKSRTAEDILRFSTSGTTPPGGNR